MKEERKKEFEIGFDSRFFDNNLTLGFTYYDNKTEDGILALPITPSSGFNTTFQNATLITNKGIEIDISANLINTEDLSFDINGSFTQNRNIVESLEGAAYFGLNGFTGTESGIAEGEPYGIQRHGQFLRDASGSLLLGSNGFPQADPELLIAGDPNPDFRAGLGTSLRYKNFNFTTQFETSQGNDVWNGTYSVMLFWGIHESTDILTTNDTGSTIFNAWGDPIPAGAQFRGYIEDFGAGPVAVDHEWWTANGGGFGDVTSQFVEDASWVKLREISLSYDFDRSLIERLGLDNLSLSNLSSLLQCQLVDITLPDRKSIENLSAIVGMNSFGSFLWQDNLENKVNIPEFFRLINLENKFHRQLFMKGMIPLPRPL